jgi:hypothetical protein
MSYVLFLDDERMPDQVTWAEFPRYDSIFIARSFDGFVRHVEFFGLPKFVCFDHDLADFHYAVMLEENAQADSYTYNDGDLIKTFDYGPEKTGYDCAKWLVEYCVNNQKKFPRYIVHSKNNVGKERIESYVENAKQHLNI